MEDDDDGREGEDGDHYEGESKDVEDSEEEEDEKDGDNEEEKGDENENETPAHEEETGEEIEDPDEETVESEMVRISNGVGIMKYVQFLNWLGEEDLPEKVQFPAPIEFKIIYNIMNLYQECVKRSDYSIKDPKLTK